MTSYIIRLPYTEFLEYFCEDMDTSHFNQYVDDDFIEIEYWYGEYKNGKSTILWRLSDTEGCQIDKNTGEPMNFHKVYRLRYTSSSLFALWWCSISDGVEDEA